jgi:GH25 family lysozyme M1 (1,4-beta-N-acetylmuramidase)
VTELHFGWDASNWDWSRGRMDLGAAAADGIVFFTHKATEGTGFRDRFFGEALRRARDAGIPFLGAYHFVRTPGFIFNHHPTGNLSDQVDFFLGYVDEQVPWWRDFRGWFWQCDLEHMGADEVAAALGMEWSNLIHERTGRTVVLYASKGVYGDGLTGARHPFWNPDYPTAVKKANGEFVCPSVHFRTAYRDSGGDNGRGWSRYANKQPVFWQFSDNATIGSQPGCDANAFRGSLRDLWALINPKARPVPMGDDMPNGDIPAGFSFDETGAWLDSTRAVAVPLPVVGAANGQWGDAWLYLAGSGDATIRFGAHNGGAWTWSDATVTLADGSAGPLPIKPGTDKLMIGRKRRSAGDTANAAPVRWHVQYAPK